MPATTSRTTRPSGNATTTRSASACCRPTRPTTPGCAAWCRGRSPRGDDLLSALVEAEGEQRLTDDEVVGMGVLLLVAGHETTVNLIGTGVLLLLRNPDQLAALRADPALLSPAIEEFLRFDGPVM